jgi:hypothetical protein
VVRRTPALGVIRADLTSATSGYLRNVRFLPRLTCNVRGRPTDARFDACYKCNDRRRTRTDMADRVGLTIYAWDDSQPGRLMDGYKNTPGASHNRIMPTSTAVEGGPCHQKSSSAYLSSSRALAHVQSIRSCSRRTLVPRRSTTKS